MTAPAGPVALGSVVEQGLGLSWTVHAAPGGLPLAELAGLALRDNPKRAQLVVSRVLAKHLPVAPSAAVDAGHRLAGLVGVEAPLVLGWCETATGLGHLVAEALPGATYLHTTRRPDPSVPLLAGFEEEHSHATGHVLQPRDPSVLHDDAPLVLVDDELTTGTTALNTVEALPRRSRYVVATLLDLRPAAAREAFAARAAALGVEVEVVSLLDGELSVPDDVHARAAVLRAELADVPPAPVPQQRGTVRVLDAGWPAGLPLGGRTGTGPGDRGPQQQALAALAARLPVRGRTLVVGTEELMWLPVRLAALLPGDVVVQSTTRSPVLPADLPGYAVRSALLFPAPDEPGRLSRLHGLPPEPYDDVVVVVDAPHWQPLAEALRPWGDVTVVPL